MSAGVFRFGRFTLDCADRRLTCDGAPVDLNARYLDALGLLVAEQGRLVPKERFLDEVWRGTPVTDEALTQCVRTLRRALGDDAARPRFIATVPKHGYRFVAEVEAVDRPRAAPPEPDHRPLPALGAAGALGGAAAGAVGGFLYGFVGAPAPLQSGVGAVSVVLVLTCLTMAVGFLGGAGVAFGVALSARLPARLGRAPILGGALGGLVVGGLVKLVGLDAFNLLFGRTPGDITGAFEGLLLGAAIGLGASLRQGRAGAVRRAVLVTAAAGGAAGLAIPLIGGHLMGGSLQLLVGRFPGSRLSLDPIGGLFGEAGFGPLSQAVTGALEGALFCACVVAAMLTAARGSHRRSPTASGA